MTKSLRPYQLEALSKVEHTLKTEKKCVLAACPSSGKTFMALSWVKSKPDTRFLILPHGTTVIKEQWKKECLAMGITNATVELPQSLYRTNVGKFDYLIIDEAHEYANASMVSTIIDKAKPKKILYLTGTPSNFIREGVTTHIIAAETLVPKYVSGLYFGLFSTNAKIIDSNYNTDLDLKKQAENKLVDSATKDVDALIEALVARLAQTGFVKQRPLLAKTKLNIFSKLGKTMIACNSIEQLGVIENCLISKGVSVISSHSKNDPESINIEKFQEYDGLNVLLVVGRGILGFNMENLVNVVDMTGSHNINRIYQLYARVMRKNENVPLKYFFKLTSTSDMQITKFYTTAAIHLMRHDFIKLYNGKNLNEMEIKVLKPTKHVRSTKQGKKQPQKNKSKKIIIDSFFSETVTANQILTDIWNNSGNQLNEYATMRIGDIKERSFSIPYRKYIKNVTELAFVKTLKTGVVDESIYY